MKIIAVIPARYESSRFQGKPLADICGKLMIERVYAQVKKVPEFDEVVVATDDQRIFDACEQRGVKVVMTSTLHRTGTDRVGEVAEKIPADLYVNVQGDEPLIEPDIIRLTLKPFLENPDTKVQMVSLMSPITEPADLANPTVCKVLTNKEGRCIYITRAVAPFPKGATAVQYYKALGLFCYTPDALKFFCDYGRKYGKAKLEAIEDIESLRLVENGYYIQFLEAQSSSLAVDTPKDLQRVIDYMKANGIE